MGTINKKHTRKLKGCCPVCGGKVRVADGNFWWWVVCDDDAIHHRLKDRHIITPYFHKPEDAIKDWNEEGDVGRYQNIVEGERKLNEDCEGEQ